jgi:hypothetical protein
VAPVHLHAFQRQAEIWNDEDRREGLLFRGRELAEAETWAAEHADELTELDREFLDACRGRLYGVYGNEELQAELRNREAKLLEQASQLKSKKPSCVSKRFGCVS